MSTADQFDTLAAVGGDLLRIVESAYAPQASTQSWLEGILESVQPFDSGGGVCAYTIRFERDGVPTAFEMASTDGADLPQFRALIERSNVSPDVVRALHAPSSRILDSEVDLPKILRRCRSSMPTFEAATGVSRLRGTMNFGVPFMQIAIGGDDRRILALAFYAQERKRRLPERARRLFPMVIAHLGAAARLRDFGGRVDAWLSPSGQVVDATGAAKEPAHRRLLTAAVQRSERARGSLRRTSPEQALAVWQGLVRAEWSLVDTVERDGKRFVLARRNRPEVPRKVALTDPERAVAYFAAAGHAQKYMAYELGISTSAVAHHLRSALLKLGLRSRVELARVYGGAPA